MEEMNPFSDKSNTFSPSLVSDINKKKYFAGRDHKYNGSRRRTQLEILSQLDDSTLEL